MDLGIIFLYQPIYNLLIVFYRGFGGELGLAIIAIALLFRLLTLPVTLRQIRMAKTNQEFSEKVNEIKKKYKDDQEKQTQEMMKIQSEYLPGQLQGCLSLILQFLMLINVFNVIRNLLEQGTAGFNEVAYDFVHPFAAGEVINPNFFGITLTESANSIGYDVISAVLPYVLLAVSVGVVQFFSTRILLALRSKKNEDSEEDDNKTKRQKKKEKAKQQNPDEPPSFTELMQQSSKQTAYILPLFIVFASLNFPAGLSIYWTASSLFVIIQQFVIDRLKNDESN